MISRATAFPIAPLQFTLRSAGIVFPGFSGSLWHGGFGEMLKRQFRHAYDLLYGGDNEARLYAILPPVAHELSEGAIFDLRITLFGPATIHALACTQAIAKLGERGLDYAGCYRLEAASTIGPRGPVPFYNVDEGLIAPPEAFDLGDYRWESKEIRRLRVRLLTPLRTKEGNELLRDPPTYEQLVHRLIGRIEQLAHVGGMPSPLPKTEHAPLLAKAKDVLLVDNALCRSDLSRRSGRTRQQMSFGGFMGELLYAGDFEQTLPWLAAGRWLQLGGKTAFGFGGIEVEYAE